MLNPLKLLLLAIVLVVGRGLLWIVNLLVVAPLFDPLRKLPGPPGPFFFSHIQSVVKPSYPSPDLSATQHEEWKKQYGKTFRYHGSGKFDYRLMTFDLRAVSHILMSPIYQKPRVTRTFLSTMLGQGIFTTEGAEHAFQRKIIGPAFNLQSIKTLTPIFLRTAEELRDKWDVIVSNGQETIDVCHWISRATFDAFGMACLTYNFRAIHGETEELYLAFRRMFDLADKKGILRILVPILDKFWPDKIVRSVLESRQVIYATGRRLISEKKSTILADKGSSNVSNERDLLSLLIQSNLCTNDPTKALSDPELLDQISSFFFAGSDTTALSLSWCLYFLALHPDIQTRLREELNHPTTLEPTSSQGFNFEDRAYDMLESFSLLDSVVRETLRLAPPVHGTLRVATQNDLIPVSEPVVLTNGTVVAPGEYIQIRKGSIIHIPIEGLNFAKDIWSEDTLQFRPDRWCSLPPVAQPPNFPGLANLMTFSFGPSSCPGYRFTITEMKAFLSTILPHYTFSVPEGQTISKRNGLFTRPFVKGKSKMGVQLPLTVKHIDEYSP
ncbi:cytochrome P450 [Lentinula aciculospora]|uniref:Cytochrome P450 n=1 Tax=Lentinula aciculospora TaxID=153920 RepID=A0A9W9AL76_9AGAR|nr:cytochrome P450 [Lentinula aciculospora]